MEELLSFFRRITKLLSYLSFAPDSSSSSPSTWQNCLFLSDEYVEFDDSREGRKGRVAADATELYLPP